MASCRFPISLVWEEYGVISMLPLRSLQGIYLEIHTTQEQDRLFCSKQRALGVFWSRLRKAGKAVGCASDGEQQRT